MRYAEFARGKGEEKSNLGRNVAIGAGVAGAGAGALRYGVPEVRARRASALRGQLMSPDKGTKKGAFRSLRHIRRDSESGGGSAVLKRDLDRLRGGISRVRDSVSNAAGSRAGRAILGTTTAGRIARGAGALGAGAAGTAAVMAYLKNRKKKNEPQGLVARGRRKINQLRGGN